MFCIKCGAEIKEGNSFCTMCGQKITEPTKSQQAEERISEENKVQAKAEPAKESTVKIAYKDKPFLSSLWDLFNTNLFFRFLLPIAPIIIFIFPAWNFISLFDGSERITEFFGNISFIVYFLYICGLLMCCAWRKMGIVIGGSGLMFIYEIIYMTESEGVTVNSLSKALFYGVVLYFTIMYMNGGMPVKRGSAATKRYYRNISGWFFAEMGSFGAALVATWIFPWTELSADKWVASFAREEIHLISGLGNIGNNLNRIFNTKVSTTTYNIAFILVIAATITAFVYLFLGILADDWHQPKGTIAAILLVSASILVEIYRVFVNAALVDVGLDKIYTFKSSGLSIAVICLSLLGTFFGHKHYNS